MEVLGWEPLFLPHGECPAFLAPEVSILLVVLFGLFQMGLELSFDFMNLLHPVSGYGIGRVDRYGWMEMGVEATLCIERALPSGDMVSIVVGDLCSRKEARPVALLEILEAEKLLF